MTLVTAIGLVREVSRSVGVSVYRVHVVLYIVECSCSRTLGLIAEEISLMRQVFIEVLEANLVRVLTSDSLNVDMGGMLPCGKLRKRTIPKHLAMLCFGDVAMALLSCIKGRGCDPVAPPRE